VDAPESTSSVTPGAAATGPTVGSVTAVPSPAPFDRRRSLEQLSSGVFDVLVIGGGVTGCGVALDASARGLRVALVEAEDFASGTSSRSSKLVHGGLRYLQQREYRLVYEALKERQRLLENAPHLVHPVPFLIPLFGRDGVVSKTVARAYSTALWLYDVTGGVRIGKRHKRISAEEALAHFPILQPDRLVAAFVYWDAQADDARLTLALARTAAIYGATIANYAPVAQLVETAGRVTGARLEDGTDVRAEVVVNAGGVWSEQIAHLAPHPAVSPVSIRPAKGIHLAFPAEKLPCEYASVLAVPGDKRTIFVIPWSAADVPGARPGPGHYTYVGTTDTDYDGLLDNPACTPEDIDYLLRAVNAWTTAKLGPDDVTGTWAGLRPLVSGARNARTADLSRRHTVITSPNGLVTVTGGKLTTYRRMAANTVDLVVRRLGRAGVGSSPTARLRLVGAPATARTGDAKAPLDRRGPRLTPAAHRHLEGRYGTETADVLAVAASDPSLLDPLVPGLPYLRAEAVWAARREMAHTLNDVLSRRTRALILDREAAASAAPDVADLLAGELGWDQTERARQIAAFELGVEAERRAGHQNATPKTTTTGAAAAP
jgi:glycerol-3-phosphate dehydrogenase